MVELGHRLKESAHALAQQIMAEVDALGRREPWHRIPQNLDQDHLPDLIRELIDTALVTFFEHDRRTALAWVAVQHGQHRFEQGVAEEVLAREYALLRWGLWQRLRREEAMETASQAIIRIDSALTFAHGACMRGYHRIIIEHGGDWPAAVERHIDDWSFFPRS